jgi:histone-lysine N-methyltransferase SETMAR
MNKENYRFYIKVRTALNIQPKFIHDELDSVFGDQAPPYNTVAKWSKLFREGREEVEDQPRPGRPVTETTSANIEEVRCLIDDDPHLTIDEIQVETGMTRGTIERIISDHLKLKKITARWVPNLLTDKQRADRVQLCKENLAKFQQGTWRLCDVLTGDESWFYHKQIGRKSSNAAWTAVGGTPPTVVRRSRFFSKNLILYLFQNDWSCVYSSR